MSHPLQIKIDHVRHAARRLVAIHGLSLVVAVGLGCALLLGLTDFLIRYQDLGVRTIATLVFVVTLVWASYRFLYLALAGRWRDVDVAQRIESRFPQLKDQLSSTIGFLATDADDALAGSAELRRAVVVETTSQVERLNLDDVIQRRPTQRALRIAGGVCLAALILIALNPRAALIAAVRLANPLSSAAWPKTHQLAFKDAPTRLATGQTFEVELIDEHGRLPDNVRIHYRFDSGGVRTEESEPMQAIGELMVARKENVNRPFEYRAEGGDDQSMPWTRLEVLEPPRVESLTVTLYPPKYTLWPIAEGDKHIQAIRGTHVALKGTTTKPIKSAMFHQDGGLEIPATVSASGYEFSIDASADSGELVVDKSGGYWIEMEDAEGLSGGALDRWEIRAVADAAPSVVIEQPTGNVFVTAEAQVPLKVVVKDDLAVHDVALHFARSDRSDVQDFVVGLYEQAKPIASPSTQDGAAAGESQVIDYAWDLASLALKPGTQVTFYASASDYLPQVGQSPPRRLTIITPQELEDRIAQRQALILGELARVLKMQQESRSQTTGLEIQLKSVGQLAKQDIDHAQGAELNQRQVTRTLTSNSEGIPAQISDLLSDLSSNKVDSPDVERRMRAIQTEIDRLAEENLSVIERELTSAIKGAQAALPGADAAKPSSKANSAIAGSLKTAGENQDAVIRSLEGMLRELSQWDNYRRFGRDVAQIKRDQDDILERTRQLGTRTLTKDLKDLDAQQQADLHKLAARQQELARRFDKVQQEMDQAKTRLGESDPLAAATIADALDQARQAAISGQMRQAGSQVDRNQVGQATEQQAKTARDLEELLDTLSNRRESELARLVKKLREAEAQLAEMRKAQAGLKKKLQDAAQESNPEKRKQELQRLAREEQALQEKVDRLARRLERLQADRAGKSLATAAGKMGRSQSAGQKGEAGEAGDKAAAAERDLDEAQQQLAERRQQAEADLAREQLAKIEDALKGLHQRQGKIVADTVELQSERVRQGELTLGQTASVRDLAREQKLLRSETSSLAEKLAAAEVFHLALERIADEMAKAAGLLQKGATDEPTQNAEQAALARCAQLLDALHAAAQKPKQGDDQGGQGGGGKQGGQQDGIRRVAEIRLLKLMQEELNTRFADFIEAQRQNPKSDDAQSLVEISREQGRLAELALKLSQPVPENPEDDPENLPDVRDDQMPDGNEPGQLPRLKLPKEDDQSPITDGLLPDADEQ